MRWVFMIQIPIYERDWENRRGVVHRVTQSSVKRVPVIQTVSIAKSSYIGKKTSKRVETVGDCCIRDGGGDDCVDWAPGTCPADCSFPMIEMRFTQVPFLLMQVPELERRLWDFKS